MQMGDFTKLFVCEPADTYHAAACDYLTSHRLADFRKSPLLQRERTQLLQKLSELRDSRYAVRALIARRINTALDPPIRVTVEQSGHLGQYRALLEQSLAGVRVQRGVVAQRIVERIMPVELVVLMRRGDAPGIAQRAGLIALNCGFGPKDLLDLCWNHIEGEHVVLPRSKTGVSQVFTLWPETRQALAELAKYRRQRIRRSARRGCQRSDEGHVFVTKFWRPWNRDAVAEQFRKLCKRAKVPCYGFYRLRHCASTAMALVAMPHVHRKFLRHKQLQQQVTYTHMPDGEVDTAIMKARKTLLGAATSDSESNPEPERAAEANADVPSGQAAPDAPGTRRRRPA